MNSVMYTPIKTIKGQSDWEKQSNPADDDILSKAVSKVRQLLKSLFN